LTTALELPENNHASFEGTKKYGAFDIRGGLAREWLAQPNPNGKSNALVVKPWRNGQDLTKRPSDTWVIDFGTHMPLDDAMLFEKPFAHVNNTVKPERMKVRRERTARLWWIHEEARVAMRSGLTGIDRFLVTPRVAKHRFFVFLDRTVLPDTRLNIIARADDTTFGILSSRIHEVWSLAQASMHGVGNDPTYNAKSCFETFPFPAGLTPRDTAHQRTEMLEGGAQIPAGLDENFAIENSPLGGKEYKDFAIKSVANNTSRSPQTVPRREAASAIAQAAHRLNALREAWLNPPEWTQRLPEVTPLGMDHSPYPDRILPRNDLSERDMKELAKRTLTNLYNQKASGQVQWLQSAHEQLDQAVAAAYGWADYTPAMPDEEILKRLLALNLERAE
jgi:hypothetical protein